MGDKISFIGGMNVPGLFGRANATTPFAELLIDDRTLCLRPRQPAALMLTRFEVDLDQISTAFPLRGTVMTGGVGFTLLDGSTAYFWTSKNKDKVLGALADRGVQVQQDPRRATQLFWSTSPRVSEAKLPGFPRPLQSLIPVLVVLSVFLVLALLANSESWRYRLSLIAIWILSAVITLTIWYRGREKDNPRDSKEPRP